MDESAKRRKAEELFANGVGVTEVGRRIGVPRSTVWGWWKRITPDLAPRVAVASEYVPPDSSQKEGKWRAAEVENAEHIKKCLQSAHFTAKIPDSKPIAITFVSDQHISVGNTVDLERMREDAEIISATDGMYAVLGGDGVDNHIKHRAAIMAARSQPQDQYELFEWYLEIFAHRILVVISGNHDAWSNQIGGVDMLGYICKRKRVCYAPDEAFVSVHLGSQTYKIGMRHQYRLNSSFNQGHAPKQWFRNGEQEWDIGCIGHHHEGALESCYLLGKERWVCRPGSYQITSAYSRQFGFNKTRPTCPTFVIYPKEREIVGFHGLKPAVKFLNAERA